jgi:hypothetical protein
MKLGTNTVFETPVHYPIPDQCHEPLHRYTKQQNKRHFGVRAVLGPLPTKFIVQQEFIYSMKKTKLTISYLTACDDSAQSRETICVISMSESIYNLIPREYVAPVKEPMHRSKHDPQGALTGSTFGMSKKSMARRFFS